MNIDSLHPETIAVIAGRPAPAPGAPLNQPITPASTFRHGGEIGYAREGNPGWEALEAALGELEHGHCVTFASGLAASNAILDELPKGARVIAQTSAVLRRLPAAARARAARPDRAGDARDADARTASPRPSRAPRWSGSSRPRIRCSTSSTCPPSSASRSGPARWSWSTTRSRRRSGRRRSRSVRISSCIPGTKLIGGHSDLLLGAVIAADPSMNKRLLDRRHGTGATPGVLEAFLALRGLRTLPARFARAPVDRSRAGHETGGSRRAWPESGIPGPGRSSRSRPWAPARTRRRSARRPGSSCTRRASAGSRRRWNGERGTRRNARSGRRRRSSGSASGWSTWRISGATSSARLPP